MLTYALFTQIGLRFLEHRGDASAFEPVPDGQTAPVAGNSEGVYTVEVDGREYTVKVSDGGDVTGIKALGQSAGAAEPNPPVVHNPSQSTPIPAPLAGNIFKVLVKPGDRVTEGQKIMVLEAMKMETDVSSPEAGIVTEMAVKEGDAVTVGQTLLSLEPAHG